MATYRINLEITGLENDSMLASMAAAMRADGHDVEATQLCGLINERAECPVNDQEWMRYVIAADLAYWSVGEPATSNT